MFPDVAADSPSSESLSFAGLVCKQDKKEISKVQKEDLEFEFSSSNVGSTNGSSNNNSSDGRLISNRNLASTCASQHQGSKHIPLENFLQPPGNRRGSDLKQTNHGSATGKPFSQGKRRTHEKGSAGGKSFSQKLFSSFATPCRDCRSSQPTPSIKQHKLQ